MNLNILANSAKIVPAIPPKPQKVNRLSVTLEGVDPRDLAEHIPMHALEEAIVTAGAIETMIERLQKRLEEKQQSWF